jgi:hypothetical protein
MGNCPSGFQTNPAGQFSCVVGCPDIQGFDLRNINGEPYCVYRDRPTVKLLLKSVQAIPGRPEDPVPTLEWLRERNPSMYNEYISARDDYDKKMPLILSQVERDQQVRDAFNALQTAENVRDQSPQAYQDARNRYYKLVKGDGWVNEESQRIANAEVNPRVNQYVQVKSDLTNRLNQQQQTIEVVNSVKDKVLSMLDDFAYTTNTFAKQISELKNQINIEKKKTEIQKVEVFSWIDSFLNIIITILVLGLLYVVIRKVVMKPTPPAYRPTSIYK